MDIVDKNRPISSIKYDDKRVAIPDNNSNHFIVHL